MPMYIVTSFWSNLGFFFIDLPTVIKFYAHKIWLCEHQKTVIHGLICYLMFQLFCYRVIFKMSGNIVAYLTSIFNDKVAYGCGEEKQIS